MRENIVARARSMAGIPYEINLPGQPKADATSRGYGKRYPEPDHGLDCSGGVLHVLQREGLLTDLIPEYTSCDTLSSRSRTISKANAAQTLPGDLVFFRGTYNTSGLSHIGIVTEAGATAMFNFVGPRSQEEPLPGRFAAYIDHYGRPEGL